MFRQPQNMQDTDSVRLFSANPPTRNSDRIGLNTIRDQTRDDHDMNNPESSSKGQIEEESRNLLEIGNDALMHLKNDRNLSAEENAYDEKATQTYVEILERATSIGQENYEAQLLGYQGLGDVYKARGKFVDAIALYNFALGIVNNDEKNQSFIQRLERYRQQLTNRIKQAEGRFLEELDSNLTVSDRRLDEAHRIYLESIRDEARAKLGQQDALTRMIEICISEETDRIEKIQYTTSILEAHQVSTEQIYRDINDRLRGFVRLMVHECQQELQTWQKAPSEEEYAIICFGSLARDEATPYSDLEFGVLLADGTDTKDRKAYFRVLTRLLNIKILNLGETTPRMQDIDELKALGLCERYSDSPNRPGFSFDGNNPGGRKTPLGNSECDDVDEADQYELIRTVAQMANLHKEEWYAKNRNLSATLLSSSLLDGNQELLNRYNEASSKILRCESKAYQEYLSGSSNPIRSSNFTIIPLKSLIEQRTFDLLISDSSKFEPNMGYYTDSLRFFDIKYELYRLPSLMLGHLALLKGVFLSNSWRKIDSLHEKDFINDVARINLHHVFSDIMKIKLKSYLRLNSRDNRIYLEARFNAADKQEDIYDRLEITEAEFFEIFYTILPFYAEIQRFIIPTPTGNMSSSDFYDRNEYVKGEIYLKLYDFQQAEASFEKMDQFNLTLSDQDQRLFLNQKGSLYYLKGNYKEAIRIFSKAINAGNGPDVTIEPNLIYNLCNAYLADGNYSKELYRDYIEKAFAIYDLLDNKVGWAIFLNLLGRLEQRLAEKKEGNYKDAIRFIDQALTINKEALGSQSVQVARNYVNLGFIYRSMSTNQKRNERINNLKLANDFYQKAIDLFDVIEGQGHPETLTVINNQAMVYAKLKKFTKAHQLNSLVLKKFEEMLGRDHPDTAMCINNKGRVFLYEEKYSEAIPLFEEAYDICKAALGENHPNTQKSLKSLNFCHIKLESGKKESKRNKRKPKKKKADKNKYVQPENIINVKPVDEIMQFIMGNS